MIVATYDRGELLPRAVKSVLRQTFGSFELLIVDDGSSDGTTEIVAAMEDPRIRYLRQRNRGVSAARNLGLASARGEWVTFLDSDDEAAASWLARLRDELVRPGVGIASTGYRVLSPPTAGAEPEEVEVRLPHSLGPAYRGQRFCYTAGALAARRELLSEIGGYAETLRFAENAELALRLVPTCLDHGLAVTAIDEPLVTYHRPPGNRRGEPKDYASMRAAAEYILEHHGDHLRATFPQGFANYHGVAAVNAARLGDPRGARRHLLAGLRAAPESWKNWLRLALTFVPRFAARFWTRRSTNDGDAEADA